jgi:hypothetical protein
MFFNFADGESRQILVYLGNNASFYIEIERISQLRERSRGRHHDEGGRFAGTNQLFQAAATFRVK